MGGVNSTNPTDPSTGATPPPAPPPSPAPAPTRKAPSRWGGCLPWVLIVGVLLAGLAIWKFPAFKAQAELGAAYAARVGCSCRYVQGRSLESCQSDFEPGMEMVSLSEDPETKTVIGSVPLLASRSARYAGASGCLLRPEN
jgi:predicted lipid-binding transport protein (Tim44 family)